MKAEPIQFCLDAPADGVYVTVPSWSGNEDHVVFITDPEDSSEWPCDCEGYRFRSYCSHQQRAWEAFCHWHSAVGPEAQDEEQEHTKTCPRCGGPTERIWRRPRA